MSPEDCIIGLFCRVDTVLVTVPKHPQANLYPSAVVTRGLVFAGHPLGEGVGPRAFYRWTTRDFRTLFPKLPQRTRVFRLVAAHREWADYFLALPTTLGVADSSGIELLHPMREGRSTRHIGRKGTSNQRGIVGGTLA